jgi:hypothetical protein
MHSWLEPLNAVNRLDHLCLLHLLSSRIRHLAYGIPVFIRMCCTSFTGHTKRLLDEYLLTESQLQTFRIEQTTTS